MNCYLCGHEIQEGQGSEPRRIFVNNQPEFEWSHTNPADHLPTLGGVRIWSAENPDDLKEFGEKIAKKRDERAAQMVEEWLIPVQDGGAVLSERAELAARIRSGG